MFALQARLAEAQTQMEKLATEMHWSRAMARELEMMQARVEAQAEMHKAEMHNQDMPSRGNQSAWGLFIRYFQWNSWPGIQDIIYPQCCNDPDCAFCSPP